MVGIVLGGNGVLACFFLFFLFFFSSKFDVCVLVFFIFYYFYAWCVLCVVWNVFLSSVECIRGGIIILLIESKLHTGFGVCEFGDK